MRRLAILIVLAATLSGCGAAQTADYLIRCSFTRSMGCS